MIKLREIMESKIDTIKVDDRVVVVDKIDGFSGNSDWEANKYKYAPIISKIVGEIGKVTAIKSSKITVEFSNSIIRSLPKYLYRKTGK